MLVDKTVAEFINELASDSPAPGGGSTAALAGALAGALATMVCNLTIGNDKYAAVEDAARTAREKAGSITAKLTACIEDDTKAFNAVMASFKMPKSTDEEKRLRTVAIQQATKEATLLPLAVAGLCLEVLKLSGEILSIGNANAASDAAVAGLMAHAGLKGALYNVKINLLGIKDSGFVQTVKGRMEVLVVQAAKLSEDLEQNADIKIS